MASPAGSIVIEDLAILKCSICLDIFTRPKLLCCGHTFCAHCITPLYTLSREQNTPLVCPECRTTVDIPHGAVDSLPPNFVIQRLLDDQARSNNNSATDIRAQANNGVDGLVHLLSQLEQRQKCLEYGENKLLNAVRQKEAAVRQKGNHVKRRVDEEVGQLLERLRSFQEDQLTVIGERRQLVQTAIDSVTCLCNLYEVDS